MVSGKKRNKRKKKGGYGKALLLIFLLCGTAGILILVHYLYGHITKEALPAYEEIHSINTDLNKAIRKIDKTIYTFLYEKRVAEKNILFLKVVSNRNQEMEWYFTELLVRFSKKYSLSQIESTIISSLSPLGPTITYRLDRVSESEVHCHIFAFGRRTHTIRLVTDAYQKSLIQDKPQLAIIIDDLGYDIEIARSFIQLHLPVSLAILPHAPYTQRIVKMANEQDCELLLHLPLEPKNLSIFDPGPGALFMKMEEQDIIDTLRKDLDQVTGARGINNHMGSLFTTKAEKMGIIFRELKERGLYYVDSRTTEDTVAYYTAKKAGVPAASRSVFLDNDLSPKAMRFQLERLLGIGRNCGYAIGIGHPHREVFHLLKDLAPLLRSKAHIVNVSQIVNQPNPCPP